jgi:hypothetical protein
METSMGDSDTPNTIPPLPPPDLPLPPRVAARPRRTLWLDEESLTLPEAVGLFFPNGPLKLKSFQTAAKNRTLASVKVNRKLLTTVGWVKDMLSPRPVPPAPRDPTPTPAPPPAPTEPIFPPGPPRPAVSSARRKLDDAFARSAKLR